MSPLVDSNNMMHKDLWYKCPWCKIYDPHVQKVVPYMTNTPTIVTERVGDKIAAVKRCPRCGFKLGSANPLENVAWWQPFDLNKYFGRTRR